MSFPPKDILAYVFVSCTHIFRMQFPLPIIQQIPDITICIPGSLLFDDFYSRCCQFGAKKISLVGNIVLDIILIFVIITLFVKIMEMRVFCVYPSTTCSMTYALVQVCLLEEFYHQLFDGKFIQEYVKNKQQSVHFFWDFTHFIS